ncbi:MAG: hypothetical protein AAGA61_05160 [Pseudomonadota bacterium]
MTIQEWGALGEVVGGIAVLVSLVYLAYQIRQNTRQIELNIQATKLASLDKTVESGNRVREMLAADADVARIFRTGMASYNSLEANDRFRANMLFRVVFAEIQANYIRNKSLELGEDHYRGSIAFMDGLLENPGVREWLTSVAVDWRPEFCTIVDARIRSLDAAATSEFEAETARDN